MFVWARSTLKALRMKRRSEDWEIECKTHDELMDGLDGVRITRRITLRGSVAAAVLLALGVPGCADSSGDGSSDDDEDEDKSSGKKRKKKDPSNKSDNDEESEGDDSSDSSDSSEEDEDSSSSSSTGGDGSGEDNDTSSGKDSGDKSDTDTGSGTGEEEEPGDPMSLQEFFDAIMADAKKITKTPDADEAEYLAKVDKFLRRVNTKVPKINAGNSFNMKNLKKQGPVTVYVMEIRPNAKIPLHNHVNHSGNVLGWRGSVKTRNFTKIDGKGDNGGFLVQETDVRTITKGKTGFLARVHNNFHMLEAGPEGATLLDVFTYWPRAGSSRFCSIGKEPVDKDKKIYEARWNWGTPEMDPRRDFD